MILQPGSRPVPNHPDYVEDLRKIRSRLPQPAATAVSLAFLAGAASSWGILVSLAYVSRPREQPLTPAAYLIRCPSPSTGNPGSARVFVTTDAGCLPALSRRCFEADWRCLPAVFPPGDEDDEDGAAPDLTGLRAWRIVLRPGEKGTIRAVVDYRVEAKPCLPQP